MDDGPDYGYSQSDNRTDPPDAEWHGREDFAEVAEAIGVTTEHVMAAMPVGDGYVVSYSEGLDPDDLDTPIYSVTLKRDPDDVLVPVGEHVQSGTFGELRARIEGRLRDHLGDPP